MNNFYIYKFEYKEKGKTISVTTIFCDRDDVNEDVLRAEIKRFYETNYQTDKVFVLGPDYLATKLKEIFIDRFDTTFKGIPKRQETSLRDGLHLVSYAKDGAIVNAGELPNGFLINFLNEGLQKIFITRGGLVTAEGAHHFVFPSRKHCDRFLRTGNILLYSSEIYFIAFAMLRHYDEKRHKQIYCDTSSINSLAFALVELKNRFLNAEEKKQIPIESFSSYDGLYKNSATYTTNALLLISASTSANIVSYILDRHSMIDRDNILILFFLGEQNKFANIKDQVICNLTQSETNLNGVPLYDTYKDGDCELCRGGSYPVEVSGDVFLLEKPHINKVLIGTKDPEGYLSDFVQQFKSHQTKDNVFKVNYKENPNFKYEVYIDFYEVLKGLKTHSRYNKYKEKLHDYIHQYAPSNTRYIITLNDKASADLGQYILDIIKENYNPSRLPEIVSQDDMVKRIADGSEGSVIVVGSCISNGKNLLYISRALRKFDKLKIVYFIGISRTKNLKYLTQLKSNLKQGIYGLETNSFHEVETIFCNNDSKETSWLVELSYLSEFINYLRDQDTPPAATLDYLEKRKALLQQSMGDEQRGLANLLFYPRPVNGQFEELKLRKNFAFFDFSGYVDDVTQADVYFTISNIINTLRNNDLKLGKDKKPVKSLQQSAFVRNLIDPANFDRFNDGIIQASILRSACAEELAYHIDSELSLTMFGTFETLIKYHEQDQGEALLEFLYALALGKLSLKLPYVSQIIALIRKNCKEEILLEFGHYIEQKLIIQPERKRKVWEEKLIRGIENDKP